MADKVASSLADDGALLAGRYRYLRELGRGGTGRVLLALDTLAQDAPRALKVVGHADAERLAWERELLGRIAHPAVARVYGLLRVEAAAPPPFGLSAGSLVMIEERAPGRPASEVARALTAEARLEFALAVCAAAARGLSAIHALGFVHGDVKPQNLISPDDGGAAKLVDLGLARPFGFAPGAGGTLAYLAPEALLGERSVATDLYALGVCMLNLLEPTLEGEEASRTESTSPASLRWQMRLDPRERARQRIDLPADVSALLEALLAQDASLRPSSARELGLRLAMALGQDAESGARPSPIERAARLGVLPAVGLEAASDELARAIEGGGLVVLWGARGSGRDRVLKEALTRLERERWARSAASLVLERASALPSVATPGRVLVIDDAEAVSLEDARAFVEASLLGPARDAPSALLLVRCGPLAGADVEVNVAPLADSDFAALAHAALERTPDARLLRTLRQTSASLAGRLISLLAEAARRELPQARVGELLEGLTELPELGVLPPEARALAESLSVAGGRLDASAISAEGMPALVAAGLASLDESGLVLRPDVCERVYDEMASDHRQARARALVPGLKALPGRAFVQACLGEHDEAERGLVRAITTLRERGQSSRAATLAELACRRLGDGREALLLAHVDALRALADYPRALARLGQRTQPAAVLARGRVLRLMGRGAEARAAFERLTDEDAPESLGAALGLARLELDAGRPSEALARAATDRAEATGLDELAAEGWEILSLEAGARGDMVEAVEAAERGLAHTRGPSLTRRRARLRATLSALRAAQGRPDEAYLLAREASELAQQAGEVHEAASFAVNLGAQELERGRPGPAREALFDGARRLRRIGRERDLARALYDLASLGLLIGDDALVRSCGERALEFAARGQDMDALALSQVALAEAAARRGELSRALEWNQQARTSAEQGSALARVVAIARAATLRLPRGQVTEARALLDELSALDDASLSPLARFEWARAEARVALATGSLDEAQAAVTRASAAVEAFGSFEAKLGASLLRAEVARANGQGALEQLALADARRLLDAMAMTLDAAARARLRQVPAYQAAFAASPAGSVAPAEDSLARFSSVARDLAAAESPEAVAHAFLDGALMLSGAERGLYLQRGESGELEVRLSRGFGGAAEHARAYSRSVVARALDLGQAVSSSSAPDAAFLGDAASVHQLSLRSLLAVPVLADGEAFGVLYLDDRLRPDAFAQELCARVMDLASLAGLAFAALRRLHRERRARGRVERLEARLARRVDVQAAELADLRPLPALADVLVARSAPMRALMARLRKFAASDAATLVVGESGVGKELVARALHALGTRSGAPFISENCGAIPEALLETTLFGHVRGAFTGADRDHVGLFEAADGGTLLLDEVAEMGPAMQARLLRVLEQGEVRPVGATTTRSVDVRLISATHGDLRARVADGSFREDLYYRLAVVQLDVPPLRERPEDLPALIASLLARYAEGRHVTVSPAALGTLTAYAWPGNVRQLENELRRALLVAENVISPEHLSAQLRPELASGGDVVQGPLDLKQQVDALERRLIRAALEAHDGNRTQAAEALGVSRYGLTKMRKRLELD